MADTERLHPQSHAELRRLVDLHGAARVRRALGDLAPETQARIRTGVETLLTPLRTQAWICCITGGLEVAIVRPVYSAEQNPATMSDDETESAIDAALMAALRDPVFALDEDDALCLLTVRDDGEPSFSAFSGGHMDEIRAKAKS